MIGLNILGDRQRSMDEVYAAAAAIGGRTYVVMNNPGMAARLLVLGKRVIYRHWPDDNAQDRFDARQFVRDRHNIAPAGCLIYLTNEPWHEDQGKMTKLSNWTMTALDECERLGRKGVIFNLSVGNPPDANVWNHARAVLEKARVGGHILGLHEYWGKDADRSPLSQRHVPWYLGRFRRIPSDILLPEIVITEFGYCHEMNPGKGYWGQMSNEDYAAGLIAADRAIYTPARIDACIFCIGSEADDFGLFSVRAGVIPPITAYNKSLTNIPVPEPPPPPLPPIDDGGIWFLRPTGFPHVVTSAFGPRVAPPPLLHEGVDYVAQPGYTGEWVVRAPQDGMVKFAGWTSDRKGYGQYVKIEHTLKGEAWVSWLGHLDSIDQGIAPGVLVQAGQRLGIAGNTGNSTARHLHWTLTNERRGQDGYPINKALDPAPYVVGQIPTQPPPVNDKEKIALALEEQAKLLTQLASQVRAM